MIKNRFSRLLFLFGAFALLSFQGCSVFDDDDDDAPATKALTVSVVSGTPKYYSLATGAEVTATGGTTWDIAFDYGRVVYTNSGATAAALSSGGTGGVWCSETTSFDTLTSASTAVFTGELATDVTKYIDYGTSMGGVSAKRLNVMTFMGYSSGTGTSDDPYSSTFLYDQDQFYSASGMPPTYSMTNNVYVIRHGDGQKYSKIQITAMELSSDSTTRTYAVTYKNF